WPIDASAISRASARPRRISVHSSAVGARRDQQPASGTRSPRKRRWSSTSTPTPANSAMMASTSRLSIREPARPWSDSAVSPTVANHAFDLQRHGQRPEVFRLGELERRAAPGPAHGADEVEDLELQRIVLVDEQVLDEGGLAVADRLPVRLRFLGGPPVDLDVLHQIIEDDVGVGLRDGQRADLL